MKHTIGLAAMASTMAFATIPTAVWAAKCVPSDIFFPSPIGVNGTAGIRIFSDCSRCSAVFASVGLTFENGTQILCTKVAAPGTCGNNTDAVNCATNNPPERTDDCLVQAGYNCIPFNQS